MVETNFRHNGMTLPKAKQNGIDMYVSFGVNPGGFLTAVLSNDLLGAFNKADSWSTELMPVIAAYIYNRVPTQCHGSKKIVNDWIKHNGQKGLERLANKQKEVEKHGTGVNT